MPDSEYQLGLARISQEQSLKEQRAYQLVGSTAQMMRHFFERGSYGTIDSRNGDTAPACWPYVRYLVADELRQKFGYGKPLFAKLDWSDPFISDLADEAKQLIKLLPRDLKHNEWLFMVRVASHMLMADPYLVEQGYVSEEGRSRVIGQSMQAGFVDGDMYELQFSAWKDKIVQK